jgi:outer membrane protein OmpA-like peptidoglycan-associated protein
VAGYGIKQWRLDLKGDGILVDTLSSGSGDPDPSFTFNLKQIGLGKIGLYENIMAEMVVADEKGQALKVTGPSASVRFIKRKERVSQKVGYKVLEKYALILFEYDSSKIKGRNRVIVGRIIERLKAFPRAIVKIVGHTDNIGKEEYNLKLSERRAKAVYKQMIEAGMTAGDNTAHEGAGFLKPLFDNALPEGRALNRTVTVSLEYEKQ